MIGPGPHILTGPVPGTAPGAALDGLPHRFLRVNVAITAALAVAGVLAFLLSQRVSSEVAVFLLQRFFPNVELSVPTLYNFGLILVNFSLALAVATVWARRARPVAVTWGSVAVLLGLFAYDEAAELHERPIRALEALLADGVVQLSVVIGGLIAVAGGAVWIYGRLLRNVPDRIRGRLLFAVTVFLAGAVVIDAVGALFLVEIGVDLHVQVLSALEEALEMLGLILFAQSLLMYLQDCLSLQLDPTVPPDGGAQG